MKTNLNVHIAGVLEKGEGLAKVVDTTVTAEKAFCFTDTVEKRDGGLEAHDTQLQIYGNIGPRELAALMKALSDRFGEMDLMRALMFAVRGKGIEVAEERDLSFREDGP